jgi:hypothetical protein
MLVSPSFSSREQATANPFPLNPTSVRDDKSMDSLAISKEAGRAALQLSRSDSQLAVTLSKSELKRVIPTRPVSCIGFPQRRLRDGDPDGSAAKPEIK